MGIKFKSTKTIYETGTELISYWHYPGQTPYEEQKEIKQLQDDFFYQMLCF